MTIDPSRVLDLFLSLAGLDHSEASRWNSLALSCARQIELRIRPGVYSDLAADALALAAAGSLLYQYVIANAAGADSIRLGDLSVTPAHASADVRTLRDELFAAAAPYLLHADAFLLQVVPDPC